MGDLPPQTRTAVARKFPSYVAAETAQQDFDLIQQATDSVLRKQLLEQMMRKAAYAREAMVRVLENSSLPSEQRSYLAGLIPLSEESDSTEP
jgi:DNA-binding phage protein